MIDPSVERVLAGIALGAVAWPLTRPCGSPEFRRAFPTLTAVAVGLLAAYAAGMVLMLPWAPLWQVRALVAIGLAMLLGVRWYASVARGSARGWPPGSLRPLALRPWFDREFFVDQHRRLGSPFKTVQFVRPMACVVGLAEGLDFMKANEAALGATPMRFGRFIPGGFLRHMPPDLHAATKNVFAAAFTRDVYGPLEPFVRGTFRAELARMAEASNAAAGRGVPPRRHIQRAMFTNWVRLFFGVEPGSPARDRLKTLYRTLDIRNPRHASDRAIRAAMAEIVALVRAEHAAGPHDPGATRSALAALERTRTGALDDAMLVGNLVYLAHTSWADVSGLLGWVFRMLTEHDAWAERLRTTTERGDGESATTLATRIVMETLRLEQSEHLYRIARRDLCWGDRVIPRGWLVRLCIRESHQDPQVFADARRFDPDRFLERTYTRREYSPFGGGLRHACIGEGLTRLVAAAFAEELALGFRWRTVADGPYEYSAWRHWRPSSAWRVHLTPIA